MNSTPSHHYYYPCFYLGDSLTASLDTVKTLLQTRIKPTQTRSLSQSYIEAHRAFTSKRIHIERAIKENMPPAAHSEDFDTGVRFPGDNIAAALQLGDIEHVTAEMEYVKVLMNSRQRPPEELSYFMETYSQAVDKHINGSGAPIKDWLKTQAQPAS